MDGTYIEVTAKQEKNEQYEHDFMVVENQGTRENEQVMIDM